MDISYTTVSGLNDLEQILGLQKQNLRHTHSPEIEAEQGFVTVQHDLDVLIDMNNAANHIITKDGDTVVGYALAMTRSFRDKIHILAPMFDLLDNLYVDGQKIGDGDYIVMGQICIHKDYRGKGIFQGMYFKYFEIYKPLYGFVITEIAARNTRSLRAHLNVGFKEIYRYNEPEIEEWVVVRF